MNTNQEISRCLGVGTTSKSFGKPCTRFGARKHYGYCASHRDQCTQAQVDRWAEAQRAIEVAQTTGIDLMKRLETLTIELIDEKARNKQLEARNTQLEEQTTSSEREVDLIRELEVEQCKSENLEYSLAAALIEIEKLKISVERLRLLEASM